MLAGVLFMGATEEQLALLNYVGIDAASYSNALLSFGFIMFLFAYTLIFLWEHLTNFSSTAQKENSGYTEEEHVPILDASSAFLDDEDDDDDDDTRHSGEPDVVELKATNRFSSGSGSNFV